MANEYTVSANLRVEKGDFNYNYNKTKSSDQTGKGGGNPGKVIVGTAVEAVSLGDVGSAGWCVMENLHGTALVDWGPQVGTSLTLTPIGELHPGEPAIFRMKHNANFLVQSDTANTGIFIAVFDK